MLICIVGRGTRSILSHITVSTVFPRIVQLYLIFLLGQEEGGQDQSPWEQRVKEAGGVERGHEVLPPAHLPRVLLEASEEVTYNGVVSMRKASFLSLDVIQWELRVYQKSRFRLVPVAARGGSYGRESSVHLDLA
jgi:hypothetical protein